MARRRRVIVLVIALAVMVSGFAYLIGVVMPKNDRPALDWLDRPTADMIQTRSQPRYGTAHGQLVPGDMNPISTDAAASKGLALFGHLDRDYALVQNMYRAILFPRLVDTLGLGAFDQELADDGIVAASGDDVPFNLYAQQCAGLPLKYLYIRNNLYMERLDQDQINAFLTHADDPGFASNPELDQIVTDTYPRVIRPLDTDIEIQTGFDASGFLFYNDAVVVYLVTSIGKDEVTPDGKGYTPVYQQRLNLVKGVIDKLNVALPATWPGHISLFQTYA